MRWYEIASRLRGIRRPKVVEIGVWQGKNAGQILRLVPGVELTLVDPWAQATPGPYMGQDSADSRTLQPDFDRIAAKVIRDFSSRARIVRRTSVDAAALLAADGEKFDLVFIDGDHSYEGCRADIEAWLPLVAQSGKSGWIGGHDYLNPRKAPDGKDRFPGVTRAVDEAFGVEVERGSDSTWWVQYRREELSL